MKYAIYKNFVTNNKIDFEYSTIETVIGSGKEKQAIWVTGEVINSTEKAILFNVNGQNHWIPKSLIYDEQVKAATTPTKA